MKPLPKIYFKVSPSWLAGFTDDKYYNTDFNK